MPIVCVCVTYDTHLFNVRPQVHVLCQSFIRVSLQRYFKPILPLEVRITDEVEGRRGQYVVDEDPFD